MELPDIYPPRLQLGLTYKDQDNGLKMAWQWLYRVGDKDNTLPLYTDDGAKSKDSIRQPYAEIQILNSIQRLCYEVPGIFNQEQVLQNKTALFGFDVVHFIQTILPELEKSPDISVVFRGEIPDFNEFTDKPTIEIGMRQTDQSTNDWFDLMVSIKLDNEEVPFEQLFTALSEGEKFLVLNSGRYFRLDHEELLSLRSLIEEARNLQDKQSDNLRLSPFQASLWQELIALGIVTQQAESWEKSVTGLMDVEYIPKVAIPKGLKATLRHYQVEGFKWMAFLWEHGLGGILADDMGLGKTLQTIALMLHIKSVVTNKQRLPMLIVAPTSVASNWIGELERFAPSLKVAYLHSGVPSELKPKRVVKKADVVVTSYALFRRYFDEYDSIDWSILVLDEAQFIKNHQTKGYQNARKLGAKFKLALSGTPLENNLMELWALLSVSAPGLFPSPKRFVDFYQRPIEKEADREMLAKLRRRVKPLMLRRSKSQVATELPPKIEQTLELELLSEHRKIYDLYLQRERQRVLGLIGDIDKNRFMIFKSITTLRMLSLDARLIDSKKYKNVPSTKLEGLLETLETVIEEGHKVLVFSQFTSYLKLIKQALDKRDIGYSYLDGSTKNRGDVVNNFKSSNIPIFLISLKAGGFGLNLTEADYCFLLDPWWNPAVEEQAIDRTHRIGQNKQVIVYRLVAKGTIEEKVMALKAKKAKLFKNVMDDDAVFASSITVDDIKGLFQD